MFIFVFIIIIIMKTYSIFTLIAGICLAAACSQPANEEPKAASFDEVVSQRRSVRAYDPAKTISKEEVSALVACAQEAPSWANTQTSRYYAVMSEDKLAALKDLIGEGNKRNTAGAPVLIVSTYVKDVAGFFRGNPANEIGNGWGAYDNGLSNAYFILKAREMGFDTLIMGMRYSEQIADLLEIPENETIMAVIALGYRAQEPSRPKRKDIESILTFK